MYQQRSLDHGKLFSIFLSKTQKNIDSLALITKSLVIKPNGGRELLCKLNHETLHALLGERLSLFQLHDEDLHGFSAYINAFRGHIDGLNEDSIEAALEKVHQARITQVFLDGSNLGGFTAVLKQRMDGSGMKTKVAEAF